MISEQSQQLVWKIVWSQKQGHSVGGQLILFRAAGIELNVFIYIVYIGEVKPSLPLKVVLGFEPEIVKSRGIK